MTGMEGPPSLLHMKLLEVNGLLLKVVYLIFYSSLSFIFSNFPRCLLDSEVSQIHAYFFINTKY